MVASNSTTCKFSTQVECYLSHLSSKAGLPWWNQLNERAHETEASCRRPSSKESKRPECKQVKLYVFTKNSVCSPERSVVISDLITQVPGNCQGTTSHQLSQQERFSAADCLPRTWIPSYFRHQFHSSG